MVTIHGSGLSGPTRLDVRYPPWFKHCNRFGPVVAVKEQCTEYNHDVGKTIRTERVRYNEKRR